MSQRRRVGVLISGRGSNFQALIDAAHDPGYPAEIACVISNVPGAAGLARAGSAGIPATAIDHKAFANREEFEEAMNEVLDTAGVEIVCNAGFMRLLTPGFVTRWRDRHLNIHPSLLPAYPGLHTHERVIAEGARVSGCTVHFVREEMDYGPIIAQAAVPVSPADTAESLAARILKAEHRLYPHALRLVAGERVRVVNGRVVGIDFEASPDALFSPPLASSEDESGNPAS